MATVDGRHRALGASGAELAARRRAADHGRRRGRAPGPALRPALGSGRGAWIPGGGAYLMVQILRDVPGRAVGANAQDEAFFT
jgi:hypothetical protein